jgi:heme-degrading monooxygenase HmoA
LILEVAILDLKPGIAEEFEATFRVASNIIMGMPGYISHELQHCLEHRDRYILLVRWEKLEDHTVGFRGSPEYQEWRSLLHHFYEPFPTVEHYQIVSNNSENI